MEDGLTDFFAFAQASQNEIIITRSTNGPFCSERILRSGVRIWLPAINNLHN